LKFLIRERVVFFNLIVAKLKIVYPKPSDLQNLSLLQDLALFDLKEMSFHRGKKIIYFNTQNKSMQIFGSNNPVKIPKREIFFHKLISG
jgi:hypothetical protein